MKEILNPYTYKQSKPMLSAVFAPCQTRGDGVPFVE